MLAPLEKILLRQVILSWPSVRLGITHTYFVTMQDPEEHHVLYLVMQVSSIFILLLLTNLVAGHKKPC